MTFYACNFFTTLCLDDATWKRSFCGGIAIYYCDLREKQTGTPLQFQKEASVVPDQTTIPHPVINQIAHLELTFSRSFPLL